MSHESPGDVALEHYSDEWLPPYKAVREGLIESFELFCKEWKMDPDKTRQLPTMTINRDGGPERGNSNGDRTYWIRRCVGCALTGHQFGASECTADTGTLHPDAPAWAKKMLDSGTLGKGGGGGRKSGGGDEVCLQESSTAGQEEQEEAQEVPQRQRQRRRGGR
jgi:hypothetical protein